MASPPTENPPGRGDAPATDDLAAQLDQATREADLVKLDDGTWFDRAANSLVEVAGAAVLVTIVGLVFGNAVSRYGLGHAAIWADELVIALMPWLAMCGMFLSVRRRQIIRIDVLVDKLPPQIRKLTRLFADLLSAAVFGYLAILAFDYVSLFGSDRTIYLRIQTGWFTSAMLIGSALAALAFLADFVRQWRERPRMPEARR
ncbi:TRAP transporter small permease [Faunimonas sp. B44]|uniref:TRAP transporter small permease n=1 Tax=Faunimonas sp. B44 TaxID=3461493 RepID=UPI00404490FA